eukprot:1733433-Prymnesium_polylepis.1
MNSRVGATHIAAIARPRRQRCRPRVVAARSLLVSSARAAVPAAVAHALGRDGGMRADRLEAPPCTAGRVGALGAGPRGGPEGASARHADHDGGRVARLCRRRAAPTADARRGRLVAGGHRGGTRPLVAPGARRTLPERWAVSAGARAQPPRPPAYAARPRRRRAFADTRAQRRADGGARRVACVAGGLLAVAASESALPHPDARVRRVLRPAPYRAA